MWKAWFISCALLTGAAQAAPPLSYTFTSIDGGSLPMASWAGRPVLVVNTASLCGYTPQYDELQTLYETYRERGLVVLAVPSDDFQQELASEADVKEFCALNFDLTLPMTDITPVTGGDAHPFYRWLAAEHGFEPEWNFNKVLIGPSGGLVATWGSAVTPLSDAITGAIEAVLRP